MSDQTQALELFYGREPRTSDWLKVDQRLINQFGEATLDTDWLHTDPERARAESPFGGTIAFGFWTISLLTYFSRQILGQDYPDGVAYGLNYGFDRVRFMSPVPVGKRIRAAVQLVAVDRRADHQYLVKTEYRIEVEGVTKPALMAEWLFLLVYASNGN